MIDTSYMYRRGDVGVPNYDKLYQKINGLCVGLLNYYFSLFSAFTKISSCQENQITSYYMYISRTTKINEEEVL